MSHLFPEHRPTHPGVFIRKDFLPNVGMTPEELADSAGLTLEEVESLLDGEIPCAAELALLIASPLKMQPEWFVEMQGRYDLDEAERQLSGGFAANP